MKNLGWILAIGWWVYFLTAIFLYVHLGFKWVNTLDVFLSLVLLIAFSVWYVVERFRPGVRKSRWTFGWNGRLYRRKSQDCSTDQKK